MSRNWRGPFSIKRRHLPQKNFIPTNKPPWGSTKTLYRGLMNGMVSRFTLSSPAPNKGDFFLTSRFERMDDRESFESWTIKSGWRKVWLLTRKSKLMKLRNMVASEIFSDLHLVLMKYKSVSQWSPMILKYLWPHSDKVRDNLLT